MAQSMFFFASSQNRFLDYLTIHCFTHMVYKNLYTNKKNIYAKTGNFFIGYRFIQGEIIAHNQNLEGGAACEPRWYAQV